MLLNEARGSDTRSIVIPPPSKIILKLSSSLYKDSSAINRLSTYAYAGLYSKTPYQKLQSNPPGENPRSPKTIFSGFFTPHPSIVYDFSSGEENSIVFHGSMLEPTRSSNQRYSVYSRFVPGLRCVSLFNFPLYTFCSIKISKFASRVTFENRLATLPEPDIPEIIPVFWFQGWGGWEEAIVSIALGTTKEETAKPVETIPVLAKEVINFLLSFFIKLSSFFLCVSIISKFKIKKTLAYHISFVVPYY